MPRKAKPLLTPAQRQADPALVEHALALIGRIHHGQPQAVQQAREELSEWSVQMPEHAQATATAWQIWELTNGSGLGRDIALPRSASEQQQARRRTLGLLGIMAFMLAGGAGGRWYWQQPIWQMALQTRRGKILTQRMPEGSSLQLAANTQAHASLYRNRRHILLTEGEAYFEVTHDTNRPFTVETQWGQVRVLGTRFTVATNADHMRVAVAQGRVAVIPKTAQNSSAPPETSTILNAGESITINTHGIQNKQTIAPADVADWTQGWLIFNNTPLPQAIARWNNYLSTPIQLTSSDRALQQLHISGRYPLANPTSFVKALQDMAGLRATQSADGRVSITSAK